MHCLRFIRKLHVSSWTWTYFQRENITKKTSAVCEHGQWIWYVCVCVTGWPTWHRILKHFLKHTAADGALRWTLNSSATHSLTSKMLKVIAPTFLLINWTVTGLVMVVDSFHSAIPCSTIVLHNKWWRGVSTECSSGRWVRTYSCIPPKTNRLAHAISLAMAGKVWSCHFK